MHDSNERVLDLRSVDQIARSSELKEIVENWGFATTLDAVRAIQTDVRASTTTTNDDLSATEYMRRTEQWLKEHRHHGYREVFNLTGTILHTNLGRAVLDESLLQRAVRKASRPITLEFDLETGKRGDREGIIRERLCQLTEAESATFVNNNAAAVLIVLNTFARDREVLVSRGELIEIGGSFRLPEIMQRAGCRLVEVGTTNRTKLRDYESAITSDTALFLKVHPSNYSIKGFTESVSERELSELSQQTGIPFAIDLGSGALVDLQRFGVPKEPLVSEALESSANIVTFSGDKLLGGPQAGLIVGASEYIDAINSNPLKRALRLDKITLAILDETLKAYENPDTLHEHVKLYSTFLTSLKQLRHRGAQVAAALRENLSDFDVEVTDSDAQVGSGTLPETRLTSIAVAISHQRSSAINKLENRLRSLQPAVIGRRHKSKLLLDMRGAEPLEELIAALQHLA